MIRKYPKHKPQTNLWRCEEELHNNHKTPGKQTKRSNQLFLPYQDDCQTRMDIKQHTANIEQLQNRKIGATVNYESTTTEPLP